MCLSASYLTSLSLPFNETQLAGSGAPTCYVSFISSAAPEVWNGGWAQMGQGLTQQGLSVRDTAWSLGSDQLRLSRGREDEADQGDILLP